VHIGKHPAAFHPQTYAVWYEHVAGVNTGLSAALQARLGAGIPISDDEVAALYESHIDAREVRAAQNVGRLLRSILHEVVMGARNAGADLSKFAEGLERRREELKAPLEQIAIQALVSGLIGDTQHMRAVTGELVDRMDANTHEVTNLQARLKEAQSQAVTDALTGLHNRRGFEEGAQALQLQSGSLAGVALLFADIDQFKNVNDLYGHALGDKVLCAVAEVIRSSVKGRDIAARLGGEEFAVLLPATSLEGAQALAEQIRQAIEKGRVRRSQGPAVGNVTISVGVAQATAEESLERLIERADAAMYAAKQAGRNRVVSAEVE
jgi:diguanylate cyclase